MMFRLIRGTKDILPPEAAHWQKIEQIARTIFALYGYQEVRTPLLEEAGLFSRSLGNSSEVVQKQMFAVKRITTAVAFSQEEEKENAVLRPEGTAAVVRAYLENNLDKKEGFAKLYYLGPMFRAERPQKGRLRQFHHIGAEAIGSLSADLDVEIVSLVQRLLKAFGIEGFEIHINSLGCTADKKKLSDILKLKLKDKLSVLCPDCQKRYEKNVFRILDCKEEACGNIVKKIELENNHLCQECRDHFQKVRDGIEALGIGYRFMPQLVRGLDYYTRTVFEVIHSLLGGQDALGAGGRYDNLVKELGGPEMGAIGFALGMERLLLVSKAESERKNSIVVYLVTIGETSRKAGIKLLNYLRENNIPADTDYQDKSLKAALRRANDLGARFVLILGEDEIKKQVVTLRDMISSAQKEVKEEDLIKEIRC